MCKGVGGSLPPKGLDSDDTGDDQATKQNRPIPGIHTRSSASEHRTTQRLDEIGQGQYPGDVSQQRRHLVNGKKGAAQKLHGQGNGHPCRGGDVGVGTQPCQGDAHRREGQDADDEQDQAPEPASDDADEPAREGDS